MPAARSHSSFGSLRFKLCVAAWAALLAGAATSGCKSDEPLAPADAYLVFEPVLEAGGTAKRSEGGLPVFRAVPLDDARVGALHAALAVGFAGEVLRTDYLVKQFVREAEVGGHRYGANAVAEAREPTIFLLAEDGAGAAARGVGFAEQGFLGRVREHRHAVWISAGTTPAEDTALAQTLTGRLGQLLAARATALGGLAAAPKEPTPLEEALGLGLEVIAREWRTGEGPRGTLAPDAGTVRQRARFADVRDNRCIYASAVDSGATEGSASLKEPTAMIGDACVSATILYRMIQSKAVGRHVAPPEVYAPFAKDRVPPGISAAAIFGPVRNALVKCLAAWGGAVLEGHTPANLIDLLRAYGELLPAEKGEALRLFVVTTYGATVLPGGVPGGGRDEKATATLSALAAEVAAGRRSLTAALDDAGRAPPARERPAPARPVR